MTRDTPHTWRATLRAGLVLLLLTTVLATPAEGALSGYSVTGRGFGHGIGLSQYGAQGQALEGRTAPQILGSYYTGTTVGQRTAGFDPRIAVVRDGAEIRAVVLDGGATVTTGATTAEAAPRSVWSVAPTTAGTCRTERPDGTASEGPCPTFDPAPGARIEVWRRLTAGWTRHHSYGRDSVVEVHADRQSDGRYRLDVVVELPMEQYLYGLSEMPYSWEPAALRAQAIAGRSYALHRLLSVGADPDRGCSCHLYDSQQDQVFAGSDRELGAASAAWWPRWQAAVDGTASTVVVADGAIGTRQGVVQAFYSSSSNGRTESKHELWGGEPFPYLLSVADPWSRLDFNPYRSWVAEIDEAVLAAALDFDDVGAIVVTGRSTSGAATEVRIDGRRNGAPVTVTRSGSWLRTAVGLRSTTVDDVFLPPFRDDDGSIFEADIAWLADRGITTGCNAANARFCPDDTVTRGQMAAFLTRALDLPKGDVVFSDSDGHLFQRDIAALAAARITTGCGGGLFCPDDAVTRGQMAAFLTRALDLPKGDVVFSDSDGHLFQRDIAALATARITTGCGGDRFCPDDPVTRAQMAAFLHRALGAGT